MSNKIYFTPGPSQLYFSVEQHIKNALKEDIASISHRGSTFSDLFRSTTDSLKELLALPDGYHIFFTSSATEVWQAIALNLIANKSYHFVNGSFGQKFSQITSQTGIVVEENNPGFGQSFEIENIPSDCDLISITLNETSAGFQFNASDLDSIRKKHPDQMIALDVVSISPAVSIDYSKVDTAYFSVQKCFGLPAGLGVWIVNERALAKADKLKKKGKFTGTYNSLDSLRQASKKYQTPATPNVLTMYLLDKVTKDMLQKGKEMMHRDTAYKAALIYQSFEENTYLEPFIETKSNRSKTVCVATVEGNNEWLLNQLLAMGFVLGKGYGAYKDRQIRVANFPTHSKEQIELLSDKIAACKPN